MRVLGVEHADAGRAVKLVTGEDVEVAVDVLHVDRQMNRGLAAVDQHRNAAGVRELHHVLDRHDGAERVRHLRDRDQPGAIGQQLLEFVDQEIAFVIDRRPLDDGAMPFPEEMPGHDVGMVLHDRDHDLVAGLDVGFAPGRGDEVDRLGRVAGEDDLLVAAGVEEFCHLGAAALIGLGRGIGEVMQPAMHVGVFALVGLGHALQHRGRLLRRRRVVEIDQRLAVHLERQRGKILPHSRHVVGTVRDRRMGHRLLSSLRPPASSAA